PEGCPQIAHLLALELDEPPQDLILECGGALLDDGDLTLEPRLLLVLGAGVREHTLRRADAPLQLGVPRGEELLHLGLHPGAVERLLELTEEQLDLRRVVGQERSEKPLQARAHLVPVELVPRSPRERGIEREQPLSRLERALLKGRDDLLDRLPQR